MGNISVGMPYFAENYGTAGLKHKFSLTAHTPFKKQDLLNIAERYGTPVYVYSENEILKRCRMLSGLFKPEVGVRWLYALKANDNPHILARIASEGFGFDTVSSEEMRLALYFSGKPQQVFYTENNMTDEEMHDAVGCGVVLNVGSVSRLETYCKAWPDTEISIRIKPDIGDGHHSKVVTGSEDSKFGIPIPKIAHCLDVAASYGVRITGIHMHIGSGIQQPENLTAAMDKLLAVSRLFPDLKTINFGGGFPIPYKKEDVEFDLAEFARLATPKLLAEKEARKGELTFVFEPGRYVVAQSGWLLTRVNTVKDQGPRVYLGCDTGFNHLVRPAMYEAWHEVVSVSKMGETPTHTYTLAGNICESGDLLAEHRLLPETVEGDLLALADAGAYGMVMASSYNRRRLPAEVLVCTDNRILSIRRRETVEEVLARHFEMCAYKPDPKSHIHH